jgi:Na+-transporting NADH:ubiquinone oxidoreductase subunit A
VNLFGHKEWTLDARLKGGRRALIVSGEWEKVFPMDIYPEQLYKAVLAFDIDKMEALGIYEVAPEDFALCEFVDASKTEIQQTIADGLARLKKEME